MSKRNTTRRIRRQAQKNNTHTRVLLDVDTLAEMADKNEFFIGIFNTLLIRLNGRLNSGGRMEMTVKDGPFAGYVFDVLLRTENGDRQPLKEMPEDSAIIRTR